MNQALQNCGCINNWTISRLVMGEAGDGDRLAGRKKRSLFQLKYKPASACLA